jgi:ribonuclease HI
MTAPPGAACHLGLPATRDCPSRWALGVIASMASSSGPFIAVASATMSDQPPSLSCARCGTSFTPRADLLERFPGWRPKECPACFRKAGSGGGAGARGGTSSSRRAGGPRAGGRPRGGIEENLTVAEVLAKYTDGPETGVFTDGAASPNPGPGGWGAVYVVDGEVVDRAHGSEPHTTNNRMELTALLHGIELVPEGTPATVYTDSNLAVRTINEWAAGWKTRGWKRKTGDVENLDLVEPLYELAQRRPEITIVWIKAHAGNRWNEYADSLATAYARDEL